MGKNSWSLEDLRVSAVADLPGNKKLLELEPAAKPKKRAKYGNTKVEWEGLEFDSKKEYKRYRELLVMVKHHEITFPERQVEYVLIEANETEKKTSYFADFRYKLISTGETVVEDVKGFRTDVYRIKKKLMVEKYGVSIKEI